MINLRSASIIFFFLFSQYAFSQGLIGDISGNLTINDLITEKVIKISPTKRIFVISNNGRGVERGDFVSLVFQGKIAARGIVAVTKDNSAGVKIVKIRSWAHWQLLRPGVDIQIIRGDDSYFKSPDDIAKQEQKSNEDGLIKSSEDLYNDVVIEDKALEIEAKKNRYIKQDNFFGLDYGFVRNIDTGGQFVNYQQFNATYGYQLRDNFWLEVSYGQNIIRDFPAASIDTTQRAITARVKFMLQIPFYSYLQPYVGFQMITADSPQAGSDPSGATSQDQLNAELALVESLAKQDVIFGATIVRHLVPGWYARLNVGSDILALGIALEF